MPGTVAAITPLFTSGDSLLYDGVIIREIPEFAGSCRTPALLVSTFGASYLCGAQALGIADEHSARKPSPISATTGRQFARPRHGNNEHRSSGELRGHLPGRDNPGLVPKGKRCNDKPARVEAKAAPERRTPHWGDDMVSSAGRSVAACKGGDGTAEPSRRIQVMRWCWRGRNQRGSEARIWCGRRD